MYEICFFSRVSLHFAFSNLSMNGQRRNSAGWSCHRQNSLYTWASDASTLPPYAKVQPRKLIQNKAILFVISAKTHGVKKSIGKFAWEKMTCLGLAEKINAAVFRYCKVQNVCPCMCAKRRRWNSWPNMCTKPYFGSLCKMLLQRNLRTHLGPIMAIEEGKIIAKAAHYLHTLTHISYLAITIFFCVTQFSELFFAQYDFNWAHCDARFPAILNNCRVKHVFQ